MTVELWVELAAAGLAGWAAWKTIPRPPTLDWERLFKVTLATVLRGEVEREEGDLDAWRARLAPVPYHPAGRQPEVRIARPESAPIPTPALDGERALLERLQQHDTPVARFDAMYRADPLAQDALLSDPALLGADYDPERCFGPGATWDAVASWSEPLQQGLQRRLDHVVVACFEPGLASALAAALPTARVEAGARTDAPDASAAEALDALLPAKSDRLVVLLPGPDVPWLLRLLHAFPGLRDRVHTVWSLGGALFDTDEDRTWGAEHFRHEELEPELQRALNYVGFIAVDPTAPLASGWAEQRFVEPPLPATGRRSIDAIDLGPLDLQGLGTASVARAIWVTLGRLAAR